MKSEQQPAKQSYFFGEGWRDLRDFISKLWNKNRDDARAYHDKYKEKGLINIKGIYWLACSMSVVLYGSIMFLLISAGVSIFLLAFFLLVYIGFSIVWVLDRLYLKKNKIFTACPSCKESSLIPVYACPSCGVKHSKLVPGKYGILKRQCTCGEKLGTCFLTGRKRYPAFCKSCAASLSDRENTPICIPVVGGRSVGKTAFITAFSKDFISTVAPRNNWETEFYNKEKEQIYREILADYNSGSTRMTDRPQDINKTSSVSFSFFLRGRGLKPERLVHVYDIAGEVFTDNSENEMQKQYEYSQGIVFIIDPFSIMEVRNTFETGLEPEDVAGIGKADVTGIVDSFINKLREVTGLSAKSMLNTPIAIVISKVDSSNLLDVLGSKVINKKRREFIDRGMDVSYIDVEDYVCREFLKEYGMESFINVIDMKFKKNRYFTCSAIGHTRDMGSYEPFGVMEPMEWLMRNADNTLDSIWNTSKFGKVPIKVEA